MQASNAFTPVNFVTMDKKKKYWLYLNQFEAAILEPH